MSGRPWPSTAADRTRAALVPTRRAGSEPPAPLPLAESLPAEPVVLLAGETEGAGWRPVVLASRAPFGVAVAGKGQPVRLPALGSESPPDASLRLPERGRDLAVQA